MGPVLVSVRLFAQLREAAGRDEVALELPDGATVGELLGALKGHDRVGGTLADLPVVIAVNRDYAERERRLNDGDEVALIPPVSGGGERVHARVTAEPLDAAALARAVGRPAAGAIVTFQGTTRDVARLEYEAYREMAQERIAAILDACVERHGLEAAAAEHRVGDVPRGEASVVVAVSAPHREEAFAGAREAIDRIKAEAPIWKKEVDQGAGGERARWVEGKLPQP
jgi:molybdopterin converting factor subunit 1